MAYDFGGPIMSQTVPVETPAQRETRDWETLGPDDHYTAQNGFVRDYSAGVLSQNAFNATGGRKNRDITLRGGDDKLAYNPADWRNPTVTQDADGRNDREYVDRTTGNSAITGAQEDYWTELAAASSGNGGLWPF